MQMLTCWEGGIGALLLPMGASGRLVHPAAGASQEVRLPSIELCHIVRITARFGASGVESSVTCRCTRCRLSCAAPSIHSHE